MRCVVKPGAVEVLRGDKTQPKVRASRTRLLRAFLYYVACLYSPRGPVQVRRACQGALIAFPPQP